MLTNDTLHIIARSALCPVDSEAPNKRVNLLSGEEIQPPLKLLKTECSLSSDPTMEPVNGELLETA